MIDLLADLRVIGGAEVRHQPHRRAGRIEDGGNRLQGSPDHHDQNEAAGDRSTLSGCALPDDIWSYAADLSPGDPNVSEAMRELLAESLRDKGYLPKPE